MPDKEAEWKKIAEYYRDKCVVYRTIMHWASPEVDWNAPVWPDGSSPDHPTTGPYRRD